MYNFDGDIMYSIDSDVTNEYVINKSKFITKLYYVDNVEEVASVLNKVKSEYSLANHYCYAYIINNISKSSDDKEPIKNSKPNLNQGNNQTQPPTNEVVIKKKGNPIGTVLLVLFIVFLFAFVYFLPEISQFIEDYKKQKSGVEDGSMKSGTMTCTLTKDNTDSLSTIYDTTFTYTKNKLKKTEQMTSYKLKDDATSTDTLDDSENECQNLKSALADVTGIDVSCAKTAVLQKTTQIIDYTKFNAEEITTNIAEYKGFYPEYQLDQSIAGIRKNLEEAGYSCQAREYVD